MEMNLSNLTNSLLGGKNGGEDNDLGFGTKITVSGERLINQDGSFNIRRTGIRNWTPYMWLVETSWPLFFLIIFLFYGLINACFAVLFVLIGVENLSGAMPSGPVADFIQAFFFSMQTFTTVGYGFISPQGNAANLLASVDALVGLMSFALATGLFFARFAKPKAQFLFSQKAIISPYKDTEWNSFQFRIANRRNNKIINLVAVVTATWIESDKGGNKTRRFYNLDLERKGVTLLPLNWTIVHIIDDNSPLFGKTREEMEALNAEFIVLIQGFDETFSQQVHASGSYTCRELLWNRRFSPMYHYEAGQVMLELDLISATVEANLSNRPGLKAGTLAKDPR